MNDALTFELCFMFEFVLRKPSGKDIPMLVLSLGSLHI